MLSPFEYEIVNREYIRCLKLINTYNQRGQKCIIFSLRSFECMINATMYANVLQGVTEQLQKDNYDVITCKREILILWDQRESVITNKNESNVEVIANKTSKKKSKKKNEDIVINHIQLKFGDFIDDFPIKTGVY